MSTGRKSQILQPVQFDQVDRHFEAMRLKEYATAKKRPAPQHLPKD